MMQVWASNRKSGTLNRLSIRPGRFSFTYDPSIEDDLSVSVTMPVRPESWIVSGSLHPVFDMNLPEGALRGWLDRAFSKVVHNFDDLELLKVVGSSQIGRLRFTSFGQELSPDDLPAISIKSLLLHRDAEELFEDLLEIYAARSGVSGVQPKVLVRAEEGRQDLSLDGRITIKAATHIVKTWTTEYPELALNEYLCLRAAERAGLPTVRSQISEDRRFIVIDRFDLQANGAFLGFEDCCVLRGLSSRRKYDSSYESVAKALSVFVLTSKKKEAMRLLMGNLALSVLVRNGDAHLKNFGILYDSPESRQGFLAPVYDIVTTVAYQPKDLMALTLKGTKRWPDRQAIEVFGSQYCSLSGRQVSEIIEAVASGVAETMPEIEQRIDDSPEFAPIGRAMRLAWQDGLATVGRKHWVVG